MQFFKVPRRNLFSKRVSLNHVREITFAPCALAENPPLVKTSLMYDTAKMPRHDFLIGPMDPARWWRRRSGASREASAEAGGKEARWAELKERLVG